MGNRYWKINKFAGMKIPLQYVSDKNGKPLSVLLAVSDWEKLMKKLARYEQVLKIRSDITEALGEVNDLRKTKQRRTTLTDFLNEL